MQQGQYSICQLNVFGKLLFLLPITNCCFGTQHLMRIGVGAHDFQVRNCVQSQLTGLSEVVSNCSSPDRAVVTILEYGDVETEYKATGIAMLSTEFPIRDGRTRLRSSKGSDHCVYVRCLDLSDEHSGELLLDDWCSKGLALEALEYCRSNHCTIPISVLISLGMKDWEVTAKNELDAQHQSVRWKLMKHWFYLQTVNGSIALVCRFIAISLVFLTTVSHLKIWID